MGILLYRYVERAVTREQTTRRKLRKELQVSHAHLDEAISYIGKVNVQVKTIEHLMTVPRRIWQGGRKEQKKMYEVLLDLILSIENVPWVVLRFVDGNDAHMVAEYHKARGEAILLQYDISNKALLESEMRTKGIAGVMGAFWVCPDTNLDAAIRVFAITPHDPQHPANDSHLFQAVVNHIYLLFMARQNNNHRHQP
jgi:hypothetical protein